MNSQDNIFQLVCGIRFQDSFKIFDEFGRLADDIMYSEKSKKVFGEKYFTAIKSVGEYQKVFCNNTNNRSNLRINPSNLIFSCDVKNFEKDFHFIKKAISEYIVPNIVDRNELNVNRLGFVFLAKSGKETLDKIKSVILNEKESKEITDFRFSKKETTLAGSIRMDKNDYINKIVSIGEIEPAIVGISFDYQMLFMPPRAEIHNLLDSFFKDAFTALQKDVYEKIQ